MIMAKAPIISWTWAPEEFEHAERTDGFYFGEVEAGNGLADCFDLGVVAVDSPEDRAAAVPASWTMPLLFCRPSSH